MITCGDVLRIIDEKAPLYRAEEWDNVGLLVGHPDNKVHRILFALDVTHEVVQEAIEKQAELIVSHHPVLFAPIRNIRWDTYKGNLLKELMKHEISVLCAHTNVDMYPFGINGFLAEQLSLVECQPLQPKQESRMLKLNAFIPTDYVEEVLSALFDAGAGKLGLYESCAFRQEGLGQFRPIGKASPFMGETDVLEMVEETKIEVLVPSPLMDQVIDALLETHPYEEPAYDVFALENKKDYFGLGVVGDLDRAASYPEFLERVKSVFGLEQICVAGPEKPLIERVAICSGAGADLMEDALAAEADVFLTGDLKYHDAQKALELGISVVDVGHFTSEHFTKGLLCNWVKESMADGSVELVLSERERNFFTLR